MRARVTARASVRVRVRVGVGVRVRVRVRFLCSRTLRRDSRGGSIPAGLLYDVLSSPSLGCGGSGRG